MDSHRRLQLYLKFNDRVVQDVYYTEEFVHDLVLVLLGEQVARLSMSLSGKTIHEEEILPGRPANLHSFVPEAFIGSIQIDLAFGNVRRKFEIYCRTQPHIEVAALNTAVRALQRGLIEGQEPDWTTFQRQWLQAPGRHPLEIRYLSGFFEYVLGSYLELSQNPQAGLHFEHAFGLIRPFSSNMAHTARCILGIKMNWFHLLQQCGTASQFYPANVFFNADVRQVLNTGSIKAGLNFNDSDGVWIDAFNEMLLRALLNFFDGAWSELREIVTGLERSPSIADRNNYDKLCFLRARIHRAQGQVDSAKACYRHFVHHPVFGPEAEVFCER